MARSISSLGSGSLLLVNNTVTLSGSNSGFTGRTIVGDGRFSSISIDSGAARERIREFHRPDQLTLNRGVFYNTGSLTIDDANREIRIGVTRLCFNVAPNTARSGGADLQSDLGQRVVTTPLFPNPVSGLFIKENSGTWC